MDFGAAQNTFIWSSCSILLGKVAGVHGLEWHECDAFEAHNKLADFGSLMTDFFFRMVRKRRIRAILAQEPQRFFQRKTLSFSAPIWIMDLWTGENLFFGK